MGFWIIWVLTAGAGGYFAFRYLSLVFAMGRVRQEMKEIRQDFTENEMLHLPLPNRHLGKLLCSWNLVLEGIREERQKYERREKEFQKQMEHISHDLRTPLTVILGYLKLARKYGIGDQMAERGNVADLEPVLREKQPDFKEREKQSDLLLILERKAEQMKGLVDQFYEYSRLNGENYKLTFEDVDLSRMVREAAADNYQILEQSSLRLQLAVPNRPVWVTGDKAALERIFLNLFQNAGRYGETYFSIGIREEQKKVSIFFANDSKILSETELPRLFDRFYMQDASRSQGGTGLGLTIAKSLAEEMNGRLYAEKDGVEIRFILDLKRKETEENL